MTLMLFNPIIVCMLYPKNDKDVLPDQWFGCSTSIMAVVIIPTIKEMLHSNNDKDALLR